MQNINPNKNFKKGDGHDDENGKKKKKQSGYCVRFLLTVALVICHFSGKLTLFGDFCFLCSL